MSFYQPLTKEDVDAKFSELGQTTVMQLVHSDELGNSEKDIADINKVFMYRNGDGDIFVAYDAIIMSYGFVLDDPTVWAGSTEFTIYIDSDNNPATGKPVQGIGCDVKLNGVGQYAWNSTIGAWESTWYESSPSLYGHILGPVFYRTYSSLSYDQAYVRAGRRFPYLDALALDTQAQAVLQITHDVFDSSLGAYVSESIDTSIPYSIGQL